MALYRYSLSGRVHCGAAGGMSAYLARGELGRDPVAGASEYLSAHPGKEAALWGGLFAPEKADERFRGLENAPTAWSEAVKAERQRNGQVAEHFIIALPKELSLEQNRWALQDHIRQFTRDGRLVQAAIHADERGGDNMHAHLLVSTRKLNEQGFERLKAHDQQSRFMHREEYVRGLRENWGHVVNRHLERHKVPERVDHRSLRAQGIDREPERHMGAWAAAREWEGLRTRVGDYNRAVRERNAQRLLHHLQQENVMSETRERPQARTGPSPTERHLWAQQIDSGYRELAHQETILSDRLQSNAREASQLGWESAKLGEELEKRRTGHDKNAYPQPQSWMGRIMTDAAKGLAADVRNYLHDRGIVRDPVQDRIAARQEWISERLGALESARPGLESARGEAREQREQRLELLGGRIHEAIRERHEQVRQMTAAREMARDRDFGLER